MTFSSDFKESKHTGDDSQLHPEAFGLSPSLVLLRNYLHLFKKVSMFLFLRSAG